MDKTAQTHAAMQEVSKIGRKWPWEALKALELGR
jgi:hypothetical protein